MSVTKKFAALGAAAAISATGLVAATGTAAHAADLTKSVSYTCSDTMGVLTGAALPTKFTIPSTVAQGSALPVTAAVTFPQTVVGAIVALAAGGTPAINGSMTGTLGFGSGTAPLTLAFNHSPVSESNPTAIANGSAAVTTGAVGSQSAVTLPTGFTAKVDVPGQTDPDTVTCTSATGADLAAGSVTVTPASTTGGGTTTPPATHKPGYAAAVSKLNKDKAALAKAKKALKKAKGHKKVVLKKKVAKLVKTVKADQAKVKSLS